MNDRLLSQEDRLLGQYLLPIKLQGLSNDIQDKMYVGYKNDLTDKREYDNEVLPCFLYITTENCRSVSCDRQGECSPEKDCL